MKAGAMEQRSNEAGMGSADRATDGSGKMGLWFRYATADGGMGIG